MRIVSFVASTSNSGKTTLIEKIVPLLKARGLRVAVVKHASGGFELDQPGKDSWRFERAGADAVVLIGPDRIAEIRKIDREPSGEELIRMGGDADVILFEGFKRNAQYKIEVFRSGVSGERPLAMDDPSFLALVSDTRFDLAIPQFNLNDADGVSEFILSRIE